MAFVGNTEHSVPYMLKHSDLFEALPQTFHHSAFLDRMHTYIPGWEVSKLRSDMFSNGYGFIVDYLAEVMKELRKEDYTNDYSKHFELSSTLTSRDRDGIIKTFSGYVKILYPDGIYTQEQAQEILEFAMESRKRIKEQLIRMDDTYETVDFTYKDIQLGETYSVETLENEMYGYSTKARDVAEVTEESNTSIEEVAKPSIENPSLQKGQIMVRDNQKGISYKSLFGDHLQGSKSLTLIDPYIRLPYQFKFLLEFCVMLYKIKAEEEEITLHIITWNDEEYKKQSEEFFYEIMLAVEDIGIMLTYEFKEEHDRSIESDNGWKILLGRGLDIFEKEEARFNLGDFDQEQRRCKNFSVTYLKG